MKNLIVMFVLIVACVAALGFYRGWFHVGSAGDVGTTDVTLTVDKSKIQDDKNKVVEKAQDLGHQAKDKAAPTTGKAKN